MSHSCLVPNLSLVPLLILLKNYPNPCSLPTGLLAPEGSWPEQAVWMLKRLVSNRFLRVKVRSRQAGRLQVAMVDESSNPQTDMGVLLVSMGYAVAEQKAPPPESLQQMTLQPKTGASPEAIPKAPGKSVQPVSVLVFVDMFGLKVR